MSQNIIQFVENDSFIIVDIGFSSYHVEHLKDFLEYNSISIVKTQMQLIDDFNHQKFNSVQSLKEYIRLDDEIIHLDNFVSKFADFHKAKIGKTIFPSFKFSLVMKLQ